MGRRFGNAAMALGLSSLMAVNAAAAGFEVGSNGSVAVSRGGAFTVKADDLTAMEHNPAGLMRGKGTRVQWSHNVVHSPARFTRAATQIPHGDNPSIKPGYEGAGQKVDPLAPTENQTPWFALGATFVAATDFGLENWAFAVGVFGPSGAGHQEWSVNGGQRYMLTKLDVLLVYYSAAMAWGKKDHYGLGATLQVAHQPKTDLSLVTDGTTGGDLAPYYSPTDVEATIHVTSAPAVTAILGGWYRLTQNWEVALSGRVVPVTLHGKGDITLANTPTGSQFSAKQLAVEGSSAKMDLVIPPTAKAGVRYRGVDGDKERYDLEFDLVYEAWSMLNEYDLRLGGTIKLFANKQAPEHVIIGKAWRDTVSARLGTTYHLKDSPLSVSAGTYVENGATPTNYANLDFTSFNRLGVSAGVQAHLSRVDLSLAYMHVFQESQTVSELYGKVYQQRPVAQCPKECQGPGGVQYDGVPANAGTFETSFDIISASVQVNF